jgi:hypothetical protein
MASWLRYLIAFVVGCHGFTYVLYGFIIPTKITMWKGSSWLLRNTIKGDRLRKLVLVLHIAAGILTFACGVAIAIAPLAPELWQPLGIVGAAIGIIGFMVFWDGQTKFLVDEGLIGASTSLALLLIVIVLPGAFD